MASENPFGPKNTSFQEVLVTALWGLVAGTIWSLFILLVMFLFGNYFNITSNLSTNDLTNSTNSIFPLILSLVSLFWISITLFLTYFFLTLINEDRFKKNRIITGQIAFFSLMAYIFFTPIYIYAGIMSYSNIMLVFLGHALLVTFGANIIMEVLNNYRYVLIGIYGSFVWLFISGIITILIFSSFSPGFARLVSLLFLLPLINSSIILCKGIFELAYLKYQRSTNMDQLWDIFYQIEMEEKENIRQEQIANGTKQ